MSHTPGPWELSKPHFGERHIYVSSWHSVDGKKCTSGKQHICVLPYEGKRGAIVYHEMFNANASLIAAAPDLLDALEAMLSYTAELNPLQGCDGHDHPAVSQARAAIAKARGAK